MSYRRSLTTTAALLRRRSHPSVSHVIRRDNDDDPKPSSHIPGHSQPAIASVVRLGFHNVAAGYTSSFARPVAYGYSFHRYMSSTGGDRADKIADAGYIAEIIPEDPVTAVASQVPAVSEVAVAAADSFFPIAGLQYFIDGIHSFTGLNWWASIALATILIRSVTIPVLINQLKATTKLNIMRPRLEELKLQMDNSAMDPDAMAKGQEKMQQLFKEHGVTPFTPLKGILIQGPIFVSFFLAIRNMTEKVPSFQSGGAYWFVDLTTPDSLLVLPILTALTFWITVECNMQEGLEGNPIAGTMKKFSRILAVVAVPVMMSFPKALFCYWLTSNLFSLTYGFVIRHPEVKKALGLTEIPVPPSPQPHSSSSAAFKRDTVVEAEPPSSADPTKTTHRRVSSVSMINQRLRTLEKKLKGTKNKKL